MRADGNITAREASGLKQRVALVTGGARGIGEAIVAELALAGATTHFTYNASSHEAEALGARLKSAGCVVFAHRVDLADANSIVPCIEAIVQGFGGLDILVNNAGRAVAGPIKTYDRRDLADMIAVNVAAPFLAIQAAVRTMKRGGRIVNIGSISSEFMPYPENSAYVMTKAAIKGLTRGLVRELAARGISVNTIQPGRVETELLRTVLDGRYETIRNSTPFGQFGRADDVAQMVTYLCSAAGDYISGAEIRVDGGVSA